ncbi:MAG TPA: nucleotidyltransferase domain-containing protein [Candidatus Brocadiales bacterium]|nr:nucleotidyltransferase domain-containing protein [Candidatus Brocadiales bacterium]
MAETVSIERLKEYFSKRQDVAFAFLFGSQARGVATKLSDVDIAVYFYPKRRYPLEYEKDVFYPSEDEIHTDLERLLKREVELLILNRVSSTITASAIRGIPLVISDWGLYLDFMLVVTRVAEDFMDLVINDYKEKTSIEKRS